jgi:hypothetical protein
MTLSEYSEIEKLLCDYINEDAYLKVNLNTYQYRKYLEYKKGYLMALCQVRRILENDLEILK